MPDGLRVILAMLPDPPEEPESDFERVIKKMLIEQFAASMPQVLAESDRLTIRLRQS
jgi:hypothetical protein